MQHYTATDGHLTTFYEKDATTPIGSMRSVTLQDLGWPEAVIHCLEVYQRYGFQNNYRYIRMDSFNVQGMVTWYK